MITEDRASKALEYLIETDKEAAELKGQVMFKEQLCKVARAQMFRTSEGSVEARKAEAELSKEVSEAEAELVTVTVEFEVVRNRRATAQTIIEMWRTEQANMRVGNV